MNRTFSAVLLHEISFPGALPQARQCESVRWRTANMNAAPLALNTFEIASEFAPALSEASCCIDNMLCVDATFFHHLGARRA